MPQNLSLENDDVITWILLSHYWRFVKGIHQSPTDSSNKGPLLPGFDVLFVAIPSTLLNKQYLDETHVTLCTCGVLEPKRTSGNHYPDHSATWNTPSVITEASQYIMGNVKIAWWRHQMETFSALLAICAGNSPVPGEFPTQRPVTRSFDVFFDLRLNKRLSKQSWDWWLETLSRPLWRHRNVMGNVKIDNDTKTSANGCTRIPLQTYKWVWYAMSSQDTVGLIYPYSSIFIRVVPLPLPPMPVNHLWRICAKWNSNKQQRKKYKKLYSNGMYFPTCFSYNVYTRNKILIE